MFNKQLTKQDTLKSYIHKTWLIMRLTAVILIAAMMQVSAAGFAQKISLTKSNASLEVVINELRTVSGYNFVATGELLDKAKPITINIKNVELEKVLERIFENQPIAFSIEDRTVTLQAKEKGFLEILTARFQAIEVKGKIIDESGNPLVGATVKIIGGTRSTSTDADGRFKLYNVEVNSMLVISYIGYQSMEIAAASDLGKITLKRSDAKLDEVQVIAYGTTTRRLSTNSIASITSEDLSKETVTNPIQALAGRIAGLEITQTNGNPGSNSKVQVRGVNNLTSSYGLSSAQPLIIIDGIPSTNLNGAIPLSDNLNADISGANNGISLFAGLNPQDIERIDVLKDADATAIYGSRGANGVILITTKRGKAGATQLNANVYSGIQQVSHLIKMLNTPQYLQLRREAFANDGVTPTAANAPDLNTWSQTDDTNWQKLLIGNTAHLTDAQASYSGGTEGLQFLVSGNYHHEGSVYKGDYGDTRLIGRLNLGTSSHNKKFKTNFSVSYTDEQNSLPLNDVSSFYSLPPNFPLYKPDGSLYWYGSLRNPMASLLQEYGNSTQFLIANGNFDYNFLKGFHFKLNAGYTRNSLRQFSTSPIASQNPTGANLVNTSRFATSISSNYIAEPQLDYSISKGKHDFSALLGTTFQQNLSTREAQTASGYAFAATMKSLGGAGTYTATSGYNLYKYAAAFARLNYRYDNKYLLNFTLRRDASSRFGPNNTFATFGALGAGWIFTDEKWLKNQASWLSFGKLRASYGTTGNDQLPNYQYLALFQPYGSYQGVSELELNGVANPNLAWESTRKFNVGLDLGFFMDRLLLTSDFYVHHSDNLLTYGNLPLQTGFSVINANLNDLVENKGFEFTLTSTNINSKNFRWTSNFNIAFQMTKLVTFDKDKTALFGSIFLEGYPVPPTYLYTYGGINAADGSVITKDLDGDTEITNTDRYPAKVHNPFYGGLNNTVTYKQFSLNFFIQFNNNYGNTNRVIGSRPGSLNNQNASVLDRWTSPGQTGTLWPAASASSAGSTDVYNSYTYYSSSDVFYGNTFWAKLRSANISYTLPKKVTQKWHIANARFFVQGQNLLTYTKQKYTLDPETGNSLPPLRNIVAGVNLTL